MPKSKHAPALFELIDQKQKAPRTGRLELPRWWKRGQQSPPDKPVEGKAEPAEPVQSVPETPVQAATQVEQPTAAEVKPIESCSPTETQVPVSRVGTMGVETKDIFSPGSGKILSVDRGRVNLSLNYVNIAVITFMLIVLVLVSYFIGAMGHRSAELTNLPEPLETTGSPEIDEAIGQPPQPRALSVDSSSPVKAVQETRRSPGAAERSVTPTAALAETGRVSGRNYVVIESFQLQHRQEAETARDWLKNQGILATLDRTESGRLVLISVDGFSGKDAAEPYCKKIVELGKKYKQEFAGKAQYSFHAPYVFREP